jgi:hypothetical protein
LNDPETFLPLNARSLHFRWQRGTHDISFDSKVLTYRHTSFSHSSTTKTPLHRLMNDFVVDTPSDIRLQYYARRLRYSSVLAGIVHFSEIPRFVPYLAPALVAYALIMLYRGFPFSWPRKQTRVFTGFGEPIVSIPHLRGIESSRQRFEEQLTSAITAAIAEEYE